MLHFSCRQPGFNATYQTRPCPPWSAGSQLLRKATKRERHSIRLMISAVERKLAWPFHPPRKECPSSQSGLVKKRFGVEAWSAGPTGVILSSGSLEATTWSILDAGLGEMVESRQWGVIRRTTLYFRACFQKMVRNNILHSQSLFV